MKKYALTDKCGEVLKTVKAHSKYEAIEFFSIIKDLKEDEMVKIFDIKKINVSTNHPHPLIERILS